MMQRELKPEEVSDLLNRNFDLQAKVNTHLAFIKPQWDQMKMAQWNLPIPTRGIAVNDDKYGQVVVFPDAVGDLHFNAFVEDRTIGTEIQKPQFESPSGNTIEQLLVDAQNGIQKILSSAVSTAIVIAVIYLYVSRKT